MSLPGVMVLLSVCSSIVLSVSWEMIANRNKFARCNNWPIRITGLLVGTGLDIASLKFGPLSLKAGLGVLNLVISPIVGKCFGVALVPLSNLLVAITGCALCIFTQFPTAPPPSVETVRQRWNSDLSIAYVSVQCALTFAASVFVMCAYFGQVRARKYPGVAYTAAAFSGSLASLLIGTLFVLGSNATEAELGLLIFFVIVLAAMEIAGVSVAFQWINDGILPTIEHLSSEFKPPPQRGIVLFTVMGIVSNAMNGLLVNREIDHMNALQKALFFIGIILCAVSMACSDVAREATKSEKYHSGQ